MWIKGALLFLLIIITGGVALLPAWICAGVAGDYDFYLLHRRHTQLWN